MNAEYERIVRIIGYIRTKTDFVPDVALVLGSGLGNFVSNVKKVCEIDYKEIEDFPVSTVEGHEGKFVFGTLGKVKLVIMQGRIHYYEGYTVKDIAVPIRTMRLLGAEKIIFTNAAGAINKNFKTGDFMLISDHISSLIPSALNGRNVDEFGERFTDMSKAYDEEFNEKALKIAQKNGITLHKGVYIQTPGPQYETPAEIRAYSLWGADAVGMSTVCETIVARHAGMRVCAVSCLTNMAAGIQKAPLSHKEVKETANKVYEQFEILISGLIKAIA